MGNKNISADLGKMISQEVERWKHLQEYGGSDPFWPDGTNMNLIRNHVIYYKRQCEEKLAPEEFPPEYQLETPPEVSNGYMARPDEIRKSAQQSLMVYEADPDFRWLQGTVGQLTEKQIKDTRIQIILNYASHLRTCIQQDNLIDMRRHQDPGRYLSDFRDCRGRVEAILGTKMGTKKELPVGQLSLFDLGIL